MDSKLNNIIEKVEKLLNLANNPSASQGEIENATKMANKLMMKHQLSSNDLLLGYSEVSKETLECFPKKSEYKEWLWDLMDAIAKGNMCTTFANKEYQWNEKTWGNEGIGFKVTLLGSKTNRRICTQMYELCVKMFPNLAEQSWKIRTKNTIKEVNQFFKNKGIRTDDININSSFLQKNKLLPTKRIFINSYYKGAIKGIKEKFQSNIAELPQDEYQKWGLMIVKNNTLLNDYIKETEGDIGKHKSRGLNIDGKAFRKGLNDAKNIDKKQITA